MLSGAGAVVTMADDEVEVVEFELRRPDGTVLCSYRLAPHLSLRFDPGHDVWGLVGPVEAWSRREGEEWHSLGPWPGRQT